MCSRPCLRRGIGWVEKEYDWRKDIEECRVGSLSIMRGEMMR